MMAEALAGSDAEYAADEAARRGDVASAQKLLGQIVAAEPANINAWLKLASLRRASGDSDGAIDAATNAVVADPIHFVALLTRGRLLEGAGRPRQAARDYIHALSLAPSDPLSVPQQFRGLIAHAKAIETRYLDWTSACWDDAIAAGPPLDADRRARIERFKTNALKRTRVYHSEPSHYHYPGLIEREFHEVSGFAWRRAVERATADIRAEMTALLTNETAVAEPYVQYADQPVRQWAALNNSLDWTALHLLKGGKLYEQNASRCPRTMATLASVPQPRLLGRGPNAMFSLLKPNTKIPPHSGISNTRLVCHLPLVVPANCRFRVGSDTRVWREGELIVFDDTIEHEAANDSELPRVVLIFDVWHPGLDEEERAAVTRVMNADEEMDGATL